jgi:hypothetical protein
MYIEKRGMITNKNGDIHREGMVREIKDGHLTQHSMSDNELKNLFSNIRLNTGFSLPDQLIQDFINDGSLIPTFKKCMHFNRTDFKNMVEPLKNRHNIRKKLPKKQTRKPKKVNRKGTKRNLKRIIKKINKKGNK